MGQAVSVPKPEEAADAPKPAEVADAPKPDEGPVAKEGGVIGVGKEELPLLAGGAKPPPPSPASPPAAEKNDDNTDNMWWFCLSASIVLFMITMVLVMLVMFSGGKVSAEDCVDCNGPDVDLRSGSDRHGPPFPPATYASLTAKTSTPTTSQATTIPSSAPREHEKLSTGSESDASDESSTESVSNATDSSLVTGSSDMPENAQKPLPPGSLLCTLGSGFKKDTYVFPPDGLCTIVTFNSLVTADGGTLTPPYDDDFTYFLETAKSHKTTEYGIGIDHEVTTNSSAMEALAADNNTKKELDDLWDQRIYHYGQVNTPLRFTSADPSSFAEDAATGLQVFSTLMLRKRLEAKRTSYVMLHFPVFSAHWARQIAKKLRDYSIDVFVAIGHHADFDYKYTRCHMVPPTILSEGLLRRALLHSEYPVRLAKILGDLASTASMWPSTTSFAVTLGMEGRWYMPNVTDTIVGIPGNYSLGQPCSMRVPKSGQLGDISKVCSNSKFNSTFYFDKKYKALVTYDKTARWLFTYDSAPALHSKLCQANLNALSFKYTLAAVNIEYEDSKNDCGHGEFPRLHRLKKLGPFLANDYTSAASESACNSMP